jgi:hypothetical protein
MNERPVWSSIPVLGVVRIGLFACSGRGLDAAKGSRVFRRLPKGIDSGSVWGKVVTEI